MECKTDRPEAKVWTVADKTLINSLFIVLYLRPILFKVDAAFVTMLFVFFINVISFPMKMMYLTEILCIIHTTLDTKM